VTKKEILDRKFYEFFNDFFCHFVFVGKKKLVFFFNIPLFKMRAKKKFHQIDLRIVKLLNLTKYGILSVFDFHGRPFKSDILRVTAVTNSRIRIVWISFFKSPWNSWIFSRCNSEYIGLRWTTMRLDSTTTIHRNMIICIFVYIIKNYTK